MTPPKSEPSITKIFVDGNCIVCDFEISHYKRLAPERFQIVDISDQNFNAESFGLTAEAVNKHMHVMTPSGSIVKGVDAFAHIWSCLPHYQIPSKVIKWPLVYNVAQIGYWLFAEIRPWLPKKKR